MWGLGLIRVLGLGFWVLPFLNEGFFKGSFEIPWRLRGLRVLGFTGLSLHYLSGSCSFQVMQDLYHQQ